MRNECKKRNERKNRKTREEHTPIIDATRYPPFKGDDSKSAAMYKKILRKVSGHIPMKLYYKRRYTSLGYLKLNFFFVLFSTNMHVYFQSLHDINFFKILKIYIYERSANVTLHQLAHPFESFIFFDFIFSSQRLA